MGNARPAAGRHHLLQTLFGNRQRDLDCPVHHLYVDLRGQLILPAHHRLHQLERRRQLFRVLRRARVQLRVQFESLADAHAELEAIQRIELLILAGGRDEALGALARAPDVKAFAQRLHARRECAIQSRALPAPVDCGVDRRGVAGQHRVARPAMPGRPCLLAGSHHRDAVVAGAPAPIRAKSNLPRTTSRAAAFSLSAGDASRISSMSCSGSNPVIATTFSQSSLSFLASVPTSLNSAESTIAGTRMPNTTFVFAGKRSEREISRRHQSRRHQCHKHQLHSTPPRPQYEPASPASNTSKVIVYRLCYRGEASMHGN